MKRPKPPSAPSAVRRLTARERAALAHDLAGYRKLHAEARREIVFHARMAISAWQGHLDTGADFWRRQALAHEADAGEHQARLDWLRSAIRRAEQEPEPLRLSEMEDRVRRLWLALVILWHALLRDEHPVLCGWCPTLQRRRARIVRWSPVKNSTGICEECKIEFERKEAEHEAHLKRGVLSYLEATKEWFHL